MQQDTNELLNVTEAQTKIIQECQALPPEVTPLASNALGLTLAEDIESDIDMPPYDKSLMDGYALRAEDIKGDATLEVIEEVTAGNTPTKEVQSQQSTRIMTGAPIPQGADAVVMHEKTALKDNRVTIQDANAKAGQNILRRASELQKGETVLTAGTMIRPQEMGVLATVGRTAVKLIPPPRVAIVSTGDELVEPMQRPREGQIRNSNGPMLVGQVHRAGGLPRYLGIARDEVDHLRSLIKEASEFPIVLLSGGVSAGKLDLVPGVLDELGVASVFHKVNLKPGKPMFFGILRREDRHSTLFFGLPGNPVSSFVCFELFVRPAIQKIRGMDKPGPHLIQAALSEKVTHRSDRPTYHPASLRQQADGMEVQLVPWLGSPDLKALTAANALALLPAGEQEFEVGQMLTVLPL